MVLPYFMVTIYSWSAVQVRLNFNVWHAPVHPKYSLVHPKSTFRLDPGNQFPDIVQYCH